jgi:hypothetical protein
VQAIIREGEDGEGDGEVMQREAASQQLTRWLHTGESVRFKFKLPAAARYQLSIRYSNDNFGPLEEVRLRIDGGSRMRFFAKDTGNYGAGWNIFERVTIPGSVTLRQGAHTLTIAVGGGDGYGVEIDRIALRKV